MGAKFYSPSYGITTVGESRDKSWEERKKRLKGKIEKGRAQVQSAYEDETEIRRQEAEYQKNLSKAKEQDRDRRRPTKWEPPTPHLR